MKPTKSIRQLTIDIGTWAVNNYDYLDTVGYGMLKQMGRWARAQLKYKQSIRSSSDKDRVICIHRIKTRQAIGDCLIFLMNWCFIKDIALSLEEAKTYVHTNRRKHDLVPVGLIMASISQLFLMHDEQISGDPILRRPYAQRIFNNLALLCYLMGEEVMFTLNYTWEKIEKLNWRKYPTDGKSN